ncbi:putative UDP-glucose:sterol glucosyltransferase [Fulvivirga imtechensis AK7]|uniref:Putative UDP-glucose:sterol glucosyltransferase n=1 Tax=Fulvivirga imtechensis AK7 TaxID=1237149 RepID=L8JQA0_9BACT|nr:nucleotide disphospho-sugar-binding domain-containing protein [Fulvivirga imtechensis]ELR69659.1 putative UDP-glucose:sterol glucosyltransferase [Fulvivirga imtechensis AK7]
MKIILFSIGTRGDMEPFLAIAQILKQRNYNVICVFPEQFRNVVEQAGLAFEGFGKHFLDLLESMEGKKLMGAQGSFFSRIKTIMKISKAMMKIHRELIEAQYEIIVREKPDRVLYHSKCLYPVVWGMANPGKAILVSPLPCILHETRHRSVLGIKGNANLGPALNRFSYWLANTVRSFVIHKQTKSYQKELDGVKFSPIRIKKALLHDTKTFYTFSPSLFPKPDYWPPQAEVVGFYEFEKATDWQPGTALTGFINRYKKIVFITFGSMSNAKPAEKTSIIIEVLRKHKIPAIINTSWGGLIAPPHYPDHVHFVENIPYDWVFQKMYAVVHHGGSGTTHTALKYGCPSLITPHIVDQYFWNSLISQLRLGPKGSPINKLNERNFESQLLDLLNNTVYKANAISMAELMNMETDKEVLFKKVVAENNIE